MKEPTSLEVVRGKKAELCDYCGEPEPDPLTPVAAALKDAP